MTNLPSGRCGPGGPGLGKRQVGPMIRRLQASGVGALDPTPCTTSAMRSILSTLVLLVFCAAPVLAQGVGAGFAVPSVDAALARVTRAGDGSATTLLRRGGAELTTWWTRPTSVSLPAFAGGPLSISLIAPDLRAVYNSALSHTLNEGALWASRGASTRLLFGGRVSTDRLELTVAPEITWSHNRAYQIVPSTEPGRHPFASPWHVAPWGSADLPMRPGAVPFLWIYPGQSSLAYRGDGVRVGVGTESRWWGPGLANALVLGGHAPGFPHAFVETSRPLDTPVGNLEAAWLWGLLTASPWFRTGREPGPRTVSGLALALSPLDELTLGLLRLVVRPGADDPLSAFDPLVSWHPARWPGDETYRPPTDQVTSVFFHAAPAERVEVYGEWARMDLPRNPRELLETPQHSQGYTLGFQWRSASGRSGRSLRFHGEVTNLEQTRIRRDRAIGPPFYTGRATDEGLTHLGRVLGASIGPGASSQRVAVDLLGPGVAPAWRVGVLGARIRWENDTMVRLPLTDPFTHDTSLLVGVRGGRRVPGFHAEAQIVYQARLNYLFQNGFNRPGGIRTVDVNNWTFGLTLRPAGDLP